MLRLSPAVVLVLAASALAQPDPAAREKLQQAADEKWRPVPNRENVRRFVEEQVPRVRHHHDYRRMLADCIAGAEALLADRAEQIARVWETGRCRREDGYLP